MVKELIERKTLHLYLIMLEEINLINNTDRISGGALIYKQVNDYEGKKIIVQPQ